MNKSFLLSVVALLGLVACSPAQERRTAKPKQSTRAATPNNNTLLWKVSGNGLEKPSYLFGTMHMICASDIGISDSLKSAIGRADKVYLELDMDNMLEMMGALTKMKMRGDTTLSDLLTPEQYDKVRTYFERNSGGMIPFSMMESFKPMLISSMVMEQSSKCANMIVMEQLVMEEAKARNVDIDGLETFAYQLDIFDRIPYKLQAKELLKMVEDTGSGNGNEMEILTNAYRKQELNKLDELTGSDESIGVFTDILLYDRNAAWAKKLQTLMAKSSLVVAVGAGHLPGEKGVINLLRKAGYKVEPVKNDMIRKGNVKEI